MKSELTKRLMQLSKDLITISQGLSLTVINRNAVEKCIEAGCNAGSDYAIASGTNTKRLFNLQINKTKCRLNACSYRLELLTETQQQMKEKIKTTFDECVELRDIFNKISRSLRKRDKRADDLADSIRENA